MEMPKWYNDKANKIDNRFKHLGSNNSEDDFSEMDNQYEELNKKIRY
jgi:hypothetical protein